MANTSPPRIWLGFCDTPGCRSLECRFGREVRFADKCSAITAARKRAGESLYAHLGIEIDAVVPHACVSGSRPVRMDARDGWHTSWE